MRTTVDIDRPVLVALKKFQRKEKRSLGRIVSQLLAEALAARRNPPRAREKFEWNVRRMGAKVDLDDKEAVYRVLDAG